MSKYRTFGPGTTEVQVLNYGMEKQVSEPSRKVLCLSSQLKTHLQQWTLVSIGSKDGLQKLQLESSWLCLRLLLTQGVEKNKVAQRRRSYRDQKKLQRSFHLSMPSLGKNSRSLLWAVICITNELVVATCSWSMVQYSNLSGCCSRIAQHFANRTVSIINMLPPMWLKMFLWLGPWACCAAKEMWGGSL